jgi:acyl CoA:acetate/3-ketoacid CoA transferase
MKRNKIISAEEAVRLIEDSDTVTLSGFVGTGCPEELAATVEKQFLETGTPRNLTLVYVAGPGDGKAKGANHFAREGLNVNVSRFGSKFTGAGGFINISQNAKAMYFLGTFMAGGQVSVKDGRLHIEDNAATKKFVRRVRQITFNGANAFRRGQTVYYITERCVFRLTSRGLELLEIAPGVDLHQDILANMEFKPQIADGVREMDPMIFRDALMGLEQHFPLDNAAKNRAEPPGAYADPFCPV